MFPVMLSALTGSGIIGPDTKTLMVPVPGRGIGFVGDRARHLRLHIADRFSRKTADENIRIIIRSRHLGIDRVRIAAPDRFIDLGVVANQKDERQVGRIGVIKTANEVGDGSAVVAYGRDIDDPGPNAFLPLPGGEWLHVLMIAVIGDDQHIAMFFDRCIFSLIEIVIQKPAFIDQLEIGDSRFGPLAVMQHIDFPGAVIDHLHRHRGINPQGLRGRVILKSIEFDYCSAVITQDIRLPQLGQCPRIPVSGVVNGAEGIRHVFGIDSTRQIALGRRHRRIRKVDILRGDDVDLHSGIVGYNDTAADARQGRLSLVQQDILVVETEEIIFLVVDHDRFFGETPKTVVDDRSKVIRLFNRDHDAIRTRTQINPFGAGNCP